MEDYAFHVEQDEDGVLIGSIPSIPGGYSQGTTLTELFQNMQEVIALCTRNNASF